MLLASLTALLIWLTTTIRYDACDFPERDLVLATRGHLAYLNALRSWIHLPTSRIMRPASCINNKSVSAKRFAFELPGCVLVWDWFRCYGTWEYRCYEIEVRMARDVGQIYILRVREINLERTYLEQVWINSSDFFGLARWYFRNEVRVLVSRVKRRL